jgi:tetratricopeptide (TPR) repeat protein
MGMLVKRIGVVVVCLAGLAGCETTSANLSFPNFFGAKDQPDTSGSVEQSASAEKNSVADKSVASEPETTGSTGVPLPDVPPPPSGENRALMGVDPNDDLSLGKRHFRAQNYGLAERYFRRAVEKSPRDAEAWLGLAAAYDRLKRFDLADRAYSQLLQIMGPTPEVLNNQGYSYMLRGDYRRARQLLLQAQAKAPDNPYVKSNLDLLARSQISRKGIE